MKENNLSKPFFEQFRECDKNGNYSNGLCVKQNVTCYAATCPYKGTAIPQPEANKGKKPCGDCENYAEYDGGLKYCSVCGTKLPIKAQAEGEAKTALYSDKWLQLILDEHSKEEIALLYQQLGLKKVELSKQLSEVKKAEKEDRPQIKNFFKETEGLDKMHHLYLNNPEFWSYTQALDKYADGLESKISNFKKVVKEYQDYIDFMGEEINSLSGIATIHGWKSTRYQEGIARRYKISELLKEL